MNILYDERLNGPLPQVDKDGLLAELRLRPLDLELLHVVEDLRPYECNRLSAYRCTSLLVALPERTEQVQGSPAPCHRLKVPTVAHGTGTGLSGGVLPPENGVLPVMARFRRILEIGSSGRFAWVQPGVRNLTISQATVPHGLYYVPDPSSQIARSIGGNVAENAGGVHYLKHDLTVHSPLQVDIVVLESERLSLGSNALNSAGFDLLALFTGSEGLLDVVMEAIVRLLLYPPVAKVLLASLDDAESAGRAVANLIGAGVAPAGLEMMDNLSIRAAKDFIHAGYPVDAAMILPCELDGAEADMHEDCERVRELFEAVGSTLVRQAQDETERQRFRTGCKNVFPAAGWISSDYYCMDGSTPHCELPRVLHDIVELSREYGPWVVNVPHAGDDNIHPLILLDAGLPGELEYAEALGGRILELCVAVGGSITGEHGVDCEKINQMCTQFNADELTLSHAVKVTFDSAGLFNPGRNVPTLHRCVGLGAMHVHHGRLLFPELERF